jgi:ketosteroid isomerase-like protein
VSVTDIQASNEKVVRRALESDPDAVDENVLWHFLSPIPELVAHFEGRAQATVDVPRMLDELTGGTFCKRVEIVWPVGDDLVVAHVEVEMTIDGVHHEGSSVIVYRIADGRVVEGFDIPSASI